MKKIVLFLTTFTAITFANAQTNVQTKSIEQIRQERARLSENASVNQTPQQRSLTALNVDTIPNLLQNLPNYLFGGCVNFSNLTYTGNPQSIGYFIDSSATIDANFTNGIILSTGKVVDAMGPNNSNNLGTNYNQGAIIDSDLSIVLPSTSFHDRAKIEFDFSANTDTISTSFLFSSEEYESFVGGGFSDVFAFFISGPGITGNQNLALVPNTTQPITINTINGITNPSYYVDLPPGSPLLQADGRTTVLSIKQAITSGATYHFKIAIADAGDALYDSQVLIKGTSFAGLNAPLAVFTDTVNSFTVDFTNYSTNATSYTWDFGDSTAVDNSANPSHTYANAGTYTVSLIAANVACSDTTTSTVTITSTVGIQSIGANNAIKVMPTATEGVYNVSIVSSVKENVSILVYDVRGQLVVNELNKQVNAGKNNFTLNLSNVANGLYTVQIIGANQAFVGKLIK